MQKNNQPVLRIYTCSDYLDPVLAERFEKQNDYQVQINTFDSNKSMFAKLSAGATGYDILNPSSYMVKSLVRDKMLMPPDAAKLSNLEHVDADYLKRAIDPQMTYSVPYMMAATCLGWLGSKVINPVASYSIFDRADIKGRITMLDDMREVLCTILLSLGHSLNSKNPAELSQARDVAIRWKMNLAKFDNEQYKSGIASGEFYLVQGYAGELLQVA